MDMLKEIERIEALAENKRDNIKLANFWKMYALELRDESNAEISNLKTQLQNWKDFCKKVQSKQLAKPAPEAQILTQQCKEIAEKITHGSTNGMHSLRLTWDELQEFANEIVRQNNTKKAPENVLVDALRNLENACDKRNKCLSPRAYLMAEECVGMRDALYELDDARSDARRAIAAYDAKATPDNGVEK